MTVREAIAWLRGLLRSVPSLPLLSDTSVEKNAEPDENPGFWPYRTPAIVPDDEPARRGDGFFPLPPTPGPGSTRWLGTVVTRPTRPRRRRIAPVRPEPNDGPVFRDLRAHMRGFQRSIGR